MVELRKRKAATEATLLPAKKANSVKSASSSKNAGSSANGLAPIKRVAAGDIVNLDDFGGEVETNEGAKVTLKKLLEDSKSGVVLFTYPKAATPGCTTQACLFRDECECLTSTGFSIYGLSTDSPKSNSSFKLKQGLPYTLLCDPSATLIKAIGMKKTPSGTTRGVFVINKEAIVEAVSPGGPAATVAMVRKLVEAGYGTGRDNGKLLDDETMGKDIEGAPPDTRDMEREKRTMENEAEAGVAAEVADTAEKLDGVNEV